MHPLWVLEYHGIRSQQDICVVTLKKRLHLLGFSATKSSGALGTSMAALGLVIAWVDSHFLTDRLTVNHEQELQEKNCF